MTNEITQAVGAPLERQVRRPAQDWMGHVEPGAMLRIKPLWNHSAHGHNCISVPCKVRAVQRGVGCQSGVLFTVRTKGGNDRVLDAAWFMPPNGALTGLPKASPSSMQG